MAAVETAEIACVEEESNGLKSEMEDDTSRVKLRKVSDSPLLVNIDDETDGDCEMSNDESKVIKKTVTKKRKVSRKAAKKVRLFGKGEILAVRSDEDDFWLCQTKQNVYENSEKFAIRWFNHDKKAKQYTLGNTDTTELECVLTNVIVNRKKVYTIDESETKRIMNIVKDAQEVCNGSEEKNSSQ